MKILKKSLRGWVGMGVVVGCCLVGSSAAAFSGAWGQHYCELRHPVESLTTARPASCEEQHIIQQQSGGGDEKNVIWINTILHDYLDRSRERPWQGGPSLSTFSTQKLQSAYMIGTYANGYHFSVYDYHGSGAWTLFEWDGASHAVYLVAALVNLPAKELTYVAYMVRHKMLRDKEAQLSDAVIGIVVDLLETSVGVAYSTVGLFTGTIAHPIDTIRNIIPAVPLLISTVVVAVKRTLYTPVVTFLAS